MTAPLEQQRPEVLTELGQETLRALLRCWFDFERRLARVPIIRRLDSGDFSIDDYRQLLLHLRAQVVEGSRWISRCASSFDRDHADIRSVIIGHAFDEHRDYEMLEQDFVASGGELAEIQAQPRNLGSEILHAYLMYRASQPNPVCLSGAMWIIEGLGNKMANDWASRIEELTGCDGSCTRFMRYHAANDDTHMDKFYGLLDRICVEQRDADAIVKTSRIVSRLYAMQLEEIDDG